MFSRKEIKEIIKKRLIFPDASNKLTRYVVGLGAIILLKVMAPTPLKLLFYNWLVATFNLNSGQNISLAEIQCNSNEYLWVLGGLSLIVISLIHNIAYQVLLFKSDKLKRENNRNSIQVDKELYQEFIELLPSNGVTIKFLREHDFGELYRQNSTEDIYTFIVTWDNAEKKFLNKVLEDKRKDFLKKMLELSNEITNNSYNIGDSIYSCIPDIYRSTDNWPKHIDEKIKKLNLLANECFEKHNELVLTAKQELTC